MTTMRYRLRLALFGATTILLVTTALVLETAPAGAQAVHRPLHATRPVGAAPVKVPFAIEYFGLEARLADEASRPAESGAAPFGEVRFRTAGRWGGWRPLGQDGAQETGQFTAALVSVDRADAYQLRGVPPNFLRATATAFNLSDGPVTSHSRRPASTAGAAANCRSRADWNADESITAWSKGTDTPQFAPAQVLTVHHTAGSNDPAQDFSKTVLAIEQYHVLTNGWSDIGYQYLVDPAGNVYEGRYAGHTSASCLAGGGDGSDFAHRPSDDGVVTGAHVAGANTGNLGIALLGCFDSQSAICQPGTYGSGDTTPTAAAMAAVEQLLARLATRHGLNAGGTTTYTNSAGNRPGMPVVSGHRDWEATACPGDNVYAQLPALRSRVAADMTPAGLRATATDSSIQLSWTAGAAWPAAPSATRYRVTRQDGAAWVTPSLGFTDSGLAPSTTYSYTVVSLASDGTSSSPAAAVTATTAAAPGDFSLAVAPSSGTTAAGTAATAQVTTAATGAVAPDLQLAAAVSPAGAGVTASLGSTALTAGGATSLTVATAAPATGTYVVTITATSSSGTTRSASYTLAVANSPPVARVTSASCSGTQCSFTGSGSDPEGGAVGLTWALPGATPATASGAGPVAATYASPGTYAVTLRATDPALLAGTATATVTCTRTKGKLKATTCSASLP
ncbi:MAG TPA: N-acetylmuramoyl-L-alanine amidase [Acidimicrobiales bacterium]|nr:N-acetylmuramoyl-L-alanine amidase [Acidimicrobiales bacterium]